MQRVGLSDPEPSPGIRPVKALDAGTVLGSYEVLEPIGAGGMGGIARVTASKVATWRSRYLPEGFSQDEARRKRFEREARVLPSLNHENIGAILRARAGRTDSNLYLAAAWSRSDEEGDHWSGMFFGYEGAHVGLE